MNILFVGGGSVGHIAPAVAVWRAMSKENPEAKAHFLCADRPDDREFLEKEKLEWTASVVPRLGLSFPLKYIRAHLLAQRLLREFRPDIIFSKGGALSVPVCFAAVQLGIPIVLHESDAVSGHANTLVSNWAAKICVGFPGVSGTFTGNPVRPTVGKGEKDEALRITGLSGDKPILLVTGGSQGSITLNEAVVANHQTLLETYDIIHITGRGKATSIELPGYWQRDFVVEEFTHLLAAADIAVSRAGAGSIGELAANSIPTLLVPLRGVGHDHQQKNAEAAESSGGCLVVQEADLETELVPALQTLWQQREQFAEGMQKLHKPDAARQIAKILSDCVASQTTPI